MINQARWKRAMVMLLVVLTIAFLLISPFRFKNLREIDVSLLDLDQGPTEDYETLKRRIYSNTKELWYYMKHELARVLTGELNPTDMQNVLDQTADRKRSLLSDLNKLTDLDGYQGWRQIEAANVSDLVQRRLHYLQNPPDCKEARKLECDLNFKDCGFGCQLHYLVYCLIFAYATERTLILNSRGWQYNTKGWESVFRPLSETCNKTFQEKMMWPAIHDPKVIYAHELKYLDNIDAITTKPKFMCLAVPKDLAHRIVRFNGDPTSWWIAQMIKYILKPQPSIKRVINKIIAKMDFASPIVGLHIRHTDKVGTEAQFHHTDEYMRHVKDYYDELELTQLVDVKKVFLATDDASVLEGARKSYPNYTFMGDPSIAKMASLEHRYSPQSLTGLLVDLELLSRCDFLVCTMSSTIGRVAYELMQTNRVDASNHFFSLDDLYFFSGQNNQETHYRVAVIPNTGINDDIAFDVNDHISIDGIHSNGYGPGTNSKTNVSGVFPWFKTVDHLLICPFPEYKQVPLHSDTQPLYYNWQHQTSFISPEKVDTY